MIYGRRLHLLGRGAAAQLLCRRTLLFGSCVPPRRTAGRLRRSTLPWAGSESSLNQPGELALRDLAVSQLRPLGLSRHGEHPRDKARPESAEQLIPLGITQRVRISDAPAQLDPAVTGVDVLPARAR